MTESKPPVAPRSVSRRLPLVIFSAIALLASLPLRAQDEARYVRLHLRDKGTPRRFLTPTDPLFSTASAHLLPRALERRAKVLPAERLVSTDDLPVHAPYLNDIRATGATVVQTSRWLNTVMVRADSMTIERLRRLPFLTKVDVVRALGRPEPIALGKLPAISSVEGVAAAAAATDCIAEHYGLSEFQNRFIGADVAHRLGIAGEGVLVGVLDAGFERRHRAFAGTRIEAEFDFIHGNTNTADEPEDSLAESPQEEHGTMVLSLIGATWRDTLVGGAPNASFILAKTEDLRFERQVEEDNFVAGLEWLEAQGVDITNTSLGYTTFDPPERPHGSDELDGHTVPASRAVNHAAMLGVFNVVAAGNEGRGGFIYVGVPAEADSAIAAAAVDSSSQVAGFSSRGRPGHIPSKPDVAAFGVGNWAAHPSSLTATRRSQGTSFAAPMTTAVAALVLSAAPELRPWELRDLLEQTATRRAIDADTAIGAGIVRASHALRRLAERRVVAGVPALSIDGNRVAIAVGLLDQGERFAAGVIADSVIYARVSIGQSQLELRSMQPVNGIARWSTTYVPSGCRTCAASIEIIDGRDGRVVRNQSFVIVGDVVGARSTLCATPTLAVLEPGGLQAYPNPFETVTSIAYEVGETDAMVSTVSLTIFNSRGEEVARLLDGARVSAGSHSHLFDARGLPSGAYCAQLRIGDETRTGEMIFLP